MPDRPLPSAGGEPQTPADVRIALAARWAEAQAAGGPLPSPCSGVCRLDASDTCLGCRRTRAEIAAWRALDEAGKARIWLRLLASGS